MTSDWQQHLAGHSVEHWQEQFNHDGYIVFENVLPSDDVDALEAALAPWFEQELQGRNDFEGLKSNRIYALLAKDPSFVELATHPLALAFAEAELGHSMLLSACLAIKLNPGETVQPWHEDDSHSGLPRPRAPLGLSAFWALDDTTAENGATQVLPGSHLWDADVFGGALTADVFADTKVRVVDDDPQPHPDAVTVTMPRGSLMLAKSNLLHRGGANKSTAPRTIVTPQYCLGWVRQLENMALTMSAEQAAALPQRARELIGYSIHPPFMGYVDGMHPNRLIDQ